MAFFLFDKAVNPNYKGGNEGESAEGETARAEEQDEIGGAKDRGEDESEESETEGDGGGGGENEKIKRKRKAPVDSLFDSLHMGFMPLSRRHKV